MNQLAGMAVFRNLPADALDRLERGGRVAEFADGTMIFAQHDEPDAVYAILAGAGHVRIGSMNRHAKMLMVENFGVGDIFGEIGVFDGGPRSADAVAEGRVPGCVKSPGSLPVGEASWLALAAGRVQSLTVVHLPSR